jgi:phosphoadenylyl-sulfate reductase (thioredoxin)
MPIDSQVLQELNAIHEPAQLLGEIFRRFGPRAAIATSGQPTDTAIIALAIAGGAKSPRVYTTDTLRLFPETYEYFEALEKRFGIKIDRYTPPEKELTRMVQQHGEYLFFNSKDKQEYCCFVRKVLPNQRALDGLDAWITGLRRDQSAARAELPRLELIEHKGSNGQARQILKINPLVDWTEKQVSEYLVQNKIPNHSLFDAKLPGGYYYESLGCVICTTPIAPHEARRAGRWRWFNALDGSKECGLHLPEEPKS